MIWDLYQESLKNKNANVKPFIFKFKTNVERFRIHYQTKNVIAGNYPHIGVTVREGIHVLYRHEGKSQWLNVDAFTSRNSPISVNMKYLASENQFYEILIYGPVLSEVNLLKIELDDTAPISLIEDDISKEILFLGGIHSLGIGCTASGVMFSNILGRKFDKHFQNISFNDRNHLKPIYDYVEESDLDNFGTIILELDYIRQDSEILDEYAKRIIRKLKSHCNNLICWYAIPESEAGRHEKLDEFAKKFSKRNVFVTDLSFIYDAKHSEMCTHSRNYINDTGNIMIYRALSEKIEEIRQMPEPNTLNDRLRGLRNGILKFNR